MSSPGTTSLRLVWEARTLGVQVGWVMLPRQPSLSPGCHEQGALAGIVAPCCDRDTALLHPVPEEKQR